MRTHTPRLDCAPNAVTSQPRSNTYPEQAAPNDRIPDSNELSTPEIRALRFGLGLGVVIGLGFALIACAVAIVIDGGLLR